MPAQTTTPGRPRRENRWFTLFLEHSSSGRWLYSTYHFCNYMAMLAGDEPPGSNAEFAKRYAVC